MLTEKASVAEALDLAQVGFLTAVNAEGQPQTSPVWFLRQDDEIIVYNRPQSPRLKSIAANDKVNLTLRADRAGNGQLTIEGRAEVDGSQPPAHAVGAYVDKYGPGIERLGYTPEQFAAEYSVALRITASRLRAWGLDNVIAGEAEVSPR